MIPSFPVVTASPKRAVGIDATGLHVPAAICSREGASARASDASGLKGPRSRSQAWARATAMDIWRILAADGFIALLRLDRKSTRLNSSHSQISYAVFCLKKKKKNYTDHRT